MFNFKHNQKLKPVKMFWGGSKKFPTPSRLASFFVLPSNISFVLPSDSEASPTYLVISSVARNLLFDNCRPLGWRLGATKKRSLGWHREGLHKNIFEQSIIYSWRK